MANELITIQQFREDVQRIVLEVAKEADLTPQQTDGLMEVVEHWVGANLTEEFVHECT